MDIFWIFNIVFNLLLLLPLAFILLVPLRMRRAARKDLPEFNVLNACVAGVVSLKYFVDIHHEYAEKEDKGVMAVGEWCDENLKKVWWFAKWDAYGYAFINKCPDDDTVIKSILKGQTPPVFMSRYYFWREEDAVAFKLRWE